ncbi:MAG: permease-like cell division protein FtsX, partial [Pseudomonadota bacterium]
VARDSRMKLLKQKRSLRKTLTLHAQAFKVSLTRLVQAPLASILTIGVISIALALPSLFLLLLKNANELSHGLNQSSQMTLYLKKQVQPNQVPAFINQLKADPEISQVKYISPQQGLVDFAEQSGYKNILSALPYNPLPAVIIVTPSININSPQSLNKLVNQLRLLPEVAQAELDVQWIRRLYAILKLATVLVWSLGLLLALAVLLIIGNTIRLTLRERLEEIRINKLFGATNSFIRKPFLYTGFCLGLFGAAIAVLLVELVILGLQKPFAHLMQLYQSYFQLIYPTAIDISFICLIGAALGVIGAWLSIRAGLRRL